MPRLIDPGEGAAIGLDELVDALDAADFDSRDEDSFAALGPLLARLGRNPDFLAELAIEELKERCEGQHRRNGYGANEVSQAASRIPGGHPEGYLEGFAQLYTDVAEQIAARIEGREPNPFSLQVPTVEHGVRGVRFIEAAVRSSQDKAAWVDV